MSYLALTHLLNEETLSGTGMTSGKIDKFPGKIFNKPVKRIKPKTITFYIDDEETKKKFNNKRRRKKNGTKGSKKRRIAKKSL